MNIHKVINNNVLSAFDDKNREVVIMGRGIGFKAKAGDVIDENKIEKVFYIESSSLSKQFQEMIADMPLEHMEISTDIIAYAKRTYEMKLNQSIYVALTDHINFAIERYRNGIQLPNALLNEIKEFYRREYAVGEYALQILQERLGVKFASDEAGFIALHFVNAQYDLSADDTYAITSIIQKSLQMISEEFGTPINEDSMYYERFITHLKFFARRVYRKEQWRDDETELADVIESKYPKEYACSQKIAAFISEKHGVNVSREEIMYLAIHIRRIFKKDNEDDCENTNKKEDK
ncbi:MAG: PRD domain-containing protein [Lachnospiraceae bacterium]|uniref:BglG family transcription antiterminator LicT n=1 Tax=Roseburia hominis TaxID=301301 RepID=UPI001F15BC4B|nr:PRD domain-containing protein [Roseburia hominis]MCI5712798.1 PRD domain-containing protein [Lachnospiraceae bacterium]MDD6170606.1 PRD domain-containing protein [Lachnospiraceae bacterium]